MANVQKENGFTAVADELLEALCRVRIPGRHYALMLAMIRKTYGYQKREDRIPVSQLVLLTQIDERGIRRILEDLVFWNMLVRTECLKGGATTWRVQKDYEQWAPGVETRAPRPEGYVDPGSADPVPPGVETRATPGVHAPLNRHTDTIQETEDVREPEFEPPAPSEPPAARPSRAKRKRSYPMPPPEAVKFSEDFRTAKLSKHPGSDPPSEAAFAGWCNEARLMLTRRPLEEARALARWLFTSEGRDAEFWRGNVLSVPTFRQQYDKLRSAKQREEKFGANNGPGSQGGGRGGRIGALEAVARARERREKERGEMAGQP